MLQGSEVVRVSPVRMVPKESQAHVASVVKLAPQGSQDRRVKMAKMDPLENPVQTDFRVRQEKGVSLDSEDLLALRGFQEKRVQLGSAVVPALQDPGEALENPAVMAPLELQE